MEVVFLRVGKTDMDFVADGEQVYLSRLKHYFSSVKVLDLKQGGKSSQEIEVKDSEAVRILETVQSGDFLVLLDEKGKTYHSKAFAAQLQKWLNRSPKRIIFAVGGALGYSEAVYQRADALLSLSAMTFSHQIIRVLFLEQLYRAATILRGEKYHNE
jgi:23S rRNA (pseudouridine1915-N3)-methyltransferase